MQAARSALSPLSASTLRSPGLGRRIKDMMLLWAGFGVVVGAVTAPGRGWIDLAAGVTAGLLVLVPAGLALALVGGRAAPALLGGAGGAAFGAVLGTFAALGGCQPLAVGLVAGAILGATLSMVSSMMTLLLARTLQFQPVFRPGPLGKAGMGRVRREAPSTLSRTTV
jgi:hypothetical protein